MTLHQRAPLLNSLGFAKPPSLTRVVVAMSGGVDSSVVAAKLKNKAGIIGSFTLSVCARRAYRKDRAWKAPGATLLLQAAGAARRHDLRHVAARIPPAPTRRSSRPYLL